MTTASPMCLSAKEGVAEIVYVETGIYDDANMQIVSGLTQNGRGSVPAGAAS